MAKKNNEIQIKNPSFRMGVDDYNKNNLAYCLVKEFNGVVEVVLSKSMTNENQFNEEVENLSKYFDAEIFKEK